MSKRSSPHSTTVSHPWVALAIQRLRERGQTAAFAESCTGGLLSAIFTRQPGVSDVFAGAVVAYSYDVKEQLLGVPSSMLRTMGAVSLPVARKMAQGVRENLRTTWSLSITGIAGPGGGTEQKPVGTVCFGLCGPGVEVVVQRRFQGDRRRIQRLSARFALQMLLSELGVDEGQRRAALKNRKPLKNS